MDNTEKNKMPLIRFAVLLVTICIGTYIVFTNFISDILPKDIDARVRIATGIDLIGAFTQKDVQVNAYKAQSEYISHRNLACINDFAWSEGNIETFLTQVKDKSHINALSNDELNRVDKCLNQIINGPKRLTTNTSSSAPKSSDVNAVALKVQVPQATAPQISYAPETIYKQNVMPELGGTPLLTAEPGYTYTVKVSGCRDQYNFDTTTRSYGIATVCAGGNLSMFNNSVYYETDTLIKGQMINGNKPQYMAVLIVGGEIVFAGNNPHSFTPQKSTLISLTNNAPQQISYYSKSRGGFDVTISRVKSS